MNAKISGNGVDHIVDSWAGTRPSARTQARSQTQYERIQFSWDQVDPEFDFSPREGVDMQHVIDDLMPLEGDWDAVLLAHNPNPERAERWPYVLVDGKHRRKTSALLGLDGGEAEIVPAGDDSYLYEAVARNQPDFKVLSDEDGCGFYNKHIRPLREANSYDPRYSVPNLAKRLHVSTSTIYAWERKENVKRAAPERGKRAAEHLSPDQLIAAYQHDLDLGTEPLEAAKNLATRLDTSLLNVQRRIALPLAREIEKGNPLALSLLSQVARPEQNSSGTDQVAALDEMIRATMKRLESYMRERDLLLAREAA